MKGLKDNFVKLVREEEGATAVEYGVLVALIIAICVVVIWQLGLRVKGGFETVNQTLQNGGVNPGTPGTGT